MSGLLDWLFGPKISAEKLEYVRGFTTAEYDGAIELNNLADQKVTEARQCLDTNLKVLEQSYKQRSNSLRSGIEYLQGIRLKLTNIATKDKILQHLPDYPPLEERINRLAGDITELEGSYEEEQDTKSGITTDLPHIKSLIRIARQLFVNGISTEDVGSYRGVAGEYDKYAKRYNSELAGERGKEWDKALAELGEGVEVAKEKAVQQVRKEISEIKVSCSDAPKESLKAYSHRIKALGDYCNIFGLDETAELSGIRDDVTKRMAEYGRREEAVEAFVGNMVSQAEKKRRQWQKDYDAVKTSGPVINPVVNRKSILQRRKAVAEQIAESIKDRLRNHRKDST